MQTTLIFFENKPKQTNIMITMIDATYLWWCGVDWLAIRENAFGENLREIWRKLQLICVLVFLFMY